MKLLICFLSFFLLNSVFSGTEYIHYPKVLEGHMEKLLSFPKSRKKAERIYQKMGTISVMLKPISVSTQNAMWDPESKVIVLNSKRTRTEGEIIQLVLFEMHNADTEDSFDQLNQLVEKGMIDRENYIRRVEYMEYQNLYDTIALFNEGVDQGYYSPESARWYIHSDFEKHYALQKQVGHAQFIGAIYDQIRCR